MASSLSNTCIFAFCISKALFKHRHAIAASAPVSATAAVALNRLHVDAPSEESGGTRDEAAERMGGGAGRSGVEVAYDARKGRSERVKDTEIAEANENVVDTMEYRSMEDMGTVETSSF